MQTPYQICEPSYRTDGQSFQPPAAGDGLWRDERLEIRQNITPRGQGIIYLERTYLNRADAPLNPVSYTHLDVYKRQIRFISMSSALLSPSSSVRLIRLTISRSEAMGVLS